MGYRTYYTLDVQNVTEEEKSDIINDIRLTSDEANYAVNSEGYPENDAKWYDCNETMIGFSKKYPDALFVLSGEGEEKDDLWTTYFQNGKYQNCPAQIIYDDFDPEKLKEYDKTD